MKTHVHDAISLWVSRWLGLEASFGMFNCWDTNHNAGSTNSQPTVKPQVGFHLQDGETWWHKKEHKHNLKQHKVTQAIRLIWWFVFLIDVYILWVCICLLCYTLICVYKYIYTYTFMYIYDECVPLKWFLRHRWRCFLLVRCHVKREDWMAWDCSLSATYCPGTYL